MIDPKQPPMLTPEAAHKIGEDLLAILNKVAKATPTPANQADLLAASGTVRDAVPNGK